LVVADQFGAQRTIEELKARYYHAVATLLRARAKPDDMQMLPLTLHFYTFNPDKEVERKRKLDLLYRRTPEQIQEEEHLFIEYRKLENSARRMLKDRQQLMRLLGDVDLSLGRSPTAATGTLIGMPYMEASGILSSEATPRRKRRTKKIKTEDVSLATAAETVHTPITITEHSTPSSSTAPTTITAKEMISSSTEESPEGNFFET
jgi:DNA methyltransferase 1-associated protein 1